MDPKMTYTLASNDDGRLALVVCEQPKWRPLHIDFSQGTVHYRQTHLQGTNELIAKAVGWKKNKPIHIFDTTAGLGREAFLLAALGAKLTLFERHPIIAALLKDGLQRAKAVSEIAPIIDRMTLIETCAISYLQSPFTDLPQVIYCDPMFETRTKSAAVKKEMQILQTVVGADTDAQQLVKLSLKVAQQRVVVKRANYAPPLMENPSFSLKGRSHRFDVYIT